MPVPNRACGTRSAYTGGCRCAPCTQANNVYMALRREDNVRDDKYQLPVGSMPGEWVDDAKCKGMNPDFFFPTGGNGMSEPEKFCRGQDGTAPCKVRRECLEFALANRIEDGIWGGEKAGTRIKIRRNWKRSA